MNRERDEVFRSYGILDLSYQQRGRDLDTIHTVHISINRVGHATTMPRQCDHVFRKLVGNCNITCVYSLCLLHLETPRP